VFFVNMAKILYANMIK